MLFNHSKSFGVQAPLPLVNIINESIDHFRFLVDHCSSAVKFSAVHHSQAHCSNVDFRQVHCSIKNWSQVYWSRKNCSHINYRHVHCSLLSLMLKSTTFFLVQCRHWSNLIQILQSCTLQTLTLKFCTMQ